MSKRRNLEIRRKVSQYVKAKEVEVAGDFFTLMCQARLRRRIGLALRILFKRPLKVAGK